MERDKYEYREVVHKEDDGLRRVVKNLYRAHDTKKKHFGLMYIAFDNFHM